MADLLPLVDLYLPNSDEARHQTGCVDPESMIARYRELAHAGTVGVKLGDCGSVVSFSPGEYVRVPAICPPLPIVDSTGAGDAFVAGFIAALVRGLPNEQAVKVAAAAGSWSVTALGEPRREKLAGNLSVSRRVAGSYQVMEPAFPDRERSHWITIDGQRMHYVDTGVGVNAGEVGAGDAVSGAAGPETWLMVHGNPTWSFYYRRVIQDFGHRFRCLAVDHVGCGLSDKPQRYEYRLNRHIANLSELIRRLDLRQITLFVHDWGGPIGLGAALETPDRIAQARPVEHRLLSAPICPLADSGLSHSDCWFDFDSRIQCVLSGRGKPGNSPSWRVELRSARGSAATV